MKPILTLLLLVSFSAGAQLPGFTLNTQRNRPSVADEIKQRQQQQAKLDAQAIGTNYVRGVEGKFSDIRRNTNWITIPNIYERGKFLQKTPDGFAFEIEHKEAGEWFYDRVVIITNCPTGYKVRGQAMSPMRLFGVGTSTYFNSAASIYDFGVLPKPITATNPPAKAAYK